VVQNPEKADLAILWAHHESDDGDVCLVLHHEGKIRGNTKFGKMVKKLPKWAWLEFLELKPYQAEERALKFCQLEAKRGGKALSEKLARSLVTAVGTDLGLLSFEIHKAAVYATTQGAKEIEASHVRAMVASIGEASPVPVMEAVGQANGARALRAMRKLRKASGSDPTMLLLTWLQRNTMQWLHAASLHANGIDPKSAAPQVGVPGFVYSKFILPVGRRWGEENLVDFIKKLSEVDRQVKTGAISPWLSLECVVLSCCTAVRRRG
jgi:DNA polymerase III delta subunit